ncbi:MAG: tetratricopeptide repeat protein [Saprospirales bacterium]|nr:MAG: tetratricopeptide repeat protein [Saprospirales bacterium]
MGVLKKMEKWALWVIFALAFLLHANTLSHDFVMDDAIVITENAFTTQGIKGIPGLLKHDTFYGFFEDAGKADLVAGGRYRPFTPMMFAVEYELFGPNPFPGHLINVLLYAITCAVLFHFFKRLFRGNFRKEFLYPVAFLLCLVFVVHPLHTEAVANIKGRDEIMALLGGLAAFYILLGKQADNLQSQILAFAVFSVGLFSKENAIVFTVVVPLALYLLKKRTIRDSLVRSAPLFIAAAVFLIARQSVLGMGIGGDAPGELMNNPFLKMEGGRYVPFDVGEKMATILVILFHYLKLMVIPWPLTHDYYPRHIEIYQMSDALPLVSLALIAFLIYLTLINFRKKPLLSYGLLFFAMALFPYSNILFPIGTNLSERFLFTPSVGACMVLGHYLNKLFHKKRPGRSSAALYAVLGISLIFALITFNRNYAWKDNYTLFTTDIAVSERSAKLNNAVAGELTSRAAGMGLEAGGREAKLQRALTHAERAIEIHPTYKNAHLLKGNALYYLERYEEAVNAYKEALALDANYREARKNIGIAYRDGGQYFGEREGNIEKALEFLIKAESYMPEDYETLRLLGVAHGFAGRHEEAVSFFGKAAEVNPDAAGAWYNLGSAYHHLGRPDMTEKYHQKAKEMEPNIVEKMRSDGQ